MFKERERERNRDRERNRYRDRNKERKRGREIERDMTKKRERERERDEKRVRGRERKKERRREKTNVCLGSLWIPSTQYSTYNIISYIKMIQVNSFRIYESILQVTFTIVKKQLNEPSREMTQTGFDQIILEVI